MLRLSWPAMVALLAKAPKPERLRWWGYFYRLWVIEHDAKLSELDRGDAFLALHKEAWPVASRLGRPPDDNSWFFANFAEIRDMLSPAWSKGIAARASAVAAVERRIIPEDGVAFQLEDSDRNNILKSRTPDLAARRILSHVYGDDDTNAIDQTLKRARRRPSS